jgi:hypothetical protein
MFIYKYMTICGSRYPPRFFPFPHSLKPRRMKLQKIFYTSKEEGRLFQDTLKLLYFIKIRFLHLEY